jgi:hypothetical protein
MDKLVISESEFAMDSIGLIEQNHGNSKLFRGFMRMKIG